MRKFSRDEVVLLRDSQVNAFASLAVYVGVWTIAQILLTLTGADMPGVQFFDPHGNFSTPGIVLGLLFFASAFLPHWLMLRRYGLSWREGARLVRDLREGLHEDAANERQPEPMAPQDAGVDPYWEQRWQEFMSQRDDQDGK